MVDQSQRAAHLAEGLLAEELPDRWSHVCAVAKKAAEVSVALDLESSILVTAAWLHDIGYAAPLRATGFHPLDGARFVLLQGFPSRVAVLVAHHSGAAIEADERGLGEQLVTEFPFVPSPAMDALWYCDMTTGPDGHTVSVEHRLAEIRARYGPSDVVTRFVERAEPELVAAVRRVEEQIAAAQSR